MKWIIVFFIIISSVISSCMVLDGLFQDMVESPQAQISTDLSTARTNQFK